VAERLEKIPEETRRVVHYLSEGQPFLLSLFVDYLAVADKLLSTIRTPLDTIKQQATFEKGLQREQVEFREAIVQGFQGIRRPLDEVIRELAWTPKGMGAELLAWLLKRDRPTEEEIRQARDYIKTLRDPEFRLSFVKIRDIDNLVFLQDEMYNLMRSLYQRGRLRYNMQQTYELIVRFYKEKIKEQVNLVRDLQEKTNKLVSSGSLKEFAEPQKTQLVTDQQNLRVARARLQSYQVEYVYYSLQFNYTIGLQAYSEFAEEAFQSNDTNLWLLLRDELLKFAKPLRESEQDKEALKYIDSDIGIRWIKSNIARGQYEKAQIQIEQFRRKCPDLLEEGSFANLNLKVWECWLLTHSGLEFRRAKDILLSVLGQTENFSDRFNPAFDEWRQHLLRAYAQDIIGYLYRSEGNFEKAVEFFRKNLPLWRYLKMVSEHANTLNNMSWSLAELGDFEAALTYCEDGLNLRRKLGHRYLIALSLNTLGLIETRNRQPERGRFRCEQALSIFRDLEQPRGIGLASHALAESLRRMTNISDLLTDEQTMNNLELAEKYAKEAIHIFTDPVKEPMRLSEAYIELGCIYREVARLVKLNTSLRNNIISKGEEAFISAEKHAGNTFVYRGYDSLVNLAWMYYYAEDFKKTQKVVHQVLDAIDKRYLFTEGHAPMEIDEPVSWFWVQLGKANLLLGKIAFDEYEQANQQDDIDKARKQLMTAAHYWVLSIAYNEKYKKDFRDMVEGRKEIYKCLGALNTREMEWIIEGIHETYNRFPHILELKSFESWVNEKFGLIS
jgi:tetratricopeptide (TPR) repeat protein